MKAIYIADDGTQFDNQDDCEFYETMTECSATCPIMSDGITTFTFKDICGESAITAFDHINFLVFRDANEYRALWKVNDDYLGYTLPDFFPDRVNYPIRFYYDKERNYGEWVNLDEELDYLQTMKKNFDKIEKGA